MLGSICNKAVNTGRLASKVCKLLTLNFSWSNISNVYAKSCVTYFCKRKGGLDGC